MSTMTGIVGSTFSGALAASLSPISETQAVTAADTDFWDVFFVILAVILVIGFFSYIVSRNKKKR